MAQDLTRQMAEYKTWREQLARSIADYRDWLSSSGTQTGLQELRLYDIEQMLQRDRLTLAFVAEFSRGKTETINALFFSDFEQRLLPSDPGRTTMCPTEIFWDEREQPCIRLLPIETRKNDDSLGFLKTQPQAWSVIRLDVDSPPTMKAAFQTVVAQKEVSLEEAKELGLWDDSDAVMQQALAASGRVAIPVWRHALINFPHPLLQNGLVILDTPGLNALGTEPELTLNIIPNAHAVIFLTATDTGVTKSDLRIWNDHIRSRNHKKIALLNKIDILWDALKPEQEIQAEIDAQLRHTARLLDLPSDSVLAISAQKALLARIRQDDALLRRSGIDQVERLLAEQVVGAKYDILRGSVVTETSAMVKASRKHIQQRLQDVRAQLDELQALHGKDRSAIETLLAAAIQSRKHYDATLATFQQGRTRIADQGKQLLQLLDRDQLQQLLRDSRQEIGDSWTTAGLNRGIQRLVRKTTQLTQDIGQQAEQIQRQAEALYRLLHEQHQFELRTPPSLDMSPFSRRMQSLEAATAAFCRDPINVMTEKHFLIRKFFMSLGRQLEASFDDSRKLANTWLKSVLAPLKQQLEAHKTSLDQRSQALLKIHNDLDTLQATIAATGQTLADLQAQGATLDRLLLRLMKEAKPADRAAAATSA